MSEWTPEQIAELRQEWGDHRGLAGRVVRSAIAEIVRLRARVADLSNGLQGSLNLADDLNARDQRREQLLRECANVFERRLAYHVEPANPKTTVGESIAARIRAELGEQT